MVQENIPSIAPVPDHDSTFGRHLRYLLRLTVLFSLLAALLGLALRYSFYRPLGIPFKFWLHGHSHVMLLGWLFQALLLLIMRQWKLMYKMELRLMYTLSALVAGMSVSFPLQGYGAVSIALSSLHLLLSVYLLLRIFRQSRYRGFSGSLFRWGTVFFCLSALGPFALGPLMAFEMQDTPYYQQAVYFYLHFLFGGTFFFFTLALLTERFDFHLLLPLRKRILPALIVGTFLLWAQKLDYSFDSWWLNAFSALGAILQLIAGLVLLRQIRHVDWAWNLLKAILLLFWLFQLLGAVPAIADHVVGKRSILIAWLHFIFLALYTPLIWFLLAPSGKAVHRLYVLYLICFLLTELALCAPWFYPGSVALWSGLTFWSYAGLTLCWIAIGIDRMRMLQTI